MISIKRMCLAVGLAFCVSNAAQADEKSPQEQWLELKSISTVCSEEGTLIVETFAKEFLPNAYGRYEKARDAAKNLNQTFNENFPEPVSTISDTYAVCERLIGRLHTATAEYRRQKDELAHLYFRHKAGVITSEELAKLDEEQQKIEIVKIDFLDTPYDIKKLGGAQSEFAEMLMPETFAQYQLFVKERAQCVRLFVELCKVREKISAPFDQVFLSVRQKAEWLGREADALTAVYNEQYLSNRIGDAPPEELAKVDQEKAAALKDLVESVPTMLREVVANPIKVICDSMVAIPGRTFKMGRTEVTQAMWRLVMGDNPSHFKGANLPVENMSWDDCQRFIQKLNAMSKNVKFRLPTKEEWEYCCRAGGTGYWGKRANGQEGPIDVMGWHLFNSSEKTHPVAQKEPNAWGLYDMHGNVSELTSEENHHGWGGYCDADPFDCRADHSTGFYGDKCKYLGFRLVCEDRTLDAPHKQKPKSAGEKPQTTENKPQSAQSVPNHTAAVLIEPQTMVMTAFEIFDKIKGSLPKDQCETSEEIIALAKKLHVEELSWFAVSFTEFPNQIQAITIGYPYPLEPVMTSITKMIDEEFEEIEIDGASEAYEVEGNITVAKVGDVVILAMTRDAVEKHVERIAKDKAAVAYAGLAPSKTGILTFKMSSMGEVMQADDGDGQVLTAINEIISVDERILKECGALTFRLTTEGATIALEAGSVEDATTIKTALDNAIPNVKTVYEQNRSELVAIPEGKRLVPAVDAAVKSLACTQQDKTVTLSIKVDVLKLAKAYVQTAENKPVQPETSKPQFVESKPVQSTSSKPQPVENKPAQPAANKPQPVTPSPARQQIVQPQPLPGGNGWVPGAYVDEVQANGSVIRVWKPGHYETGNTTQPRTPNPVQFKFQQKLDKKIQKHDKKIQRKLRKL